MWGYRITSILNKCMMKIKIYGKLSSDSKKPNLLSVDNIRTKSMIYNSDGLSVYAIVFDVSEMHLEGLNSDKCVINGNIEININVDADDTVQAKIGIYPCSTSTTINKDYVKGGLVIKILDPQSNELFVKALSKEKFDSYDSDVLNKMLKCLSIGSAIRNYVHRLSIQI